MAEEAILRIILQDATAALVSGAVPSAGSPRTPPAGTTGATAGSAGGIGGLDARRTIDALHNLGETFKRVVAPLVDILSGIRQAPQATVPMGTVGTQGTSAASSDTVIPAAKIDKLIAVGEKTLGAVESLRPILEKSAPAAFQPTASDQGPFRALLREMAGVRQLMDKMVNNQVNLEVKQSPAEWMAEVLDQFKKIAMNPVGALAGAIGGAAKGAGKGAINIAAGAALGAAKLPFKIFDQLLTGGEIGQALKSLKDWFTGKDVQTEVILSPLERIAILGAATVSAIESLKPIMEGTIGATESLRQPLEEMVQGVKDLANEVKPVPDLVRQPPATTLPLEPEQPPPEAEPPPEPPPSSVPPQVPYPVSPPSVRPPAATSTYDVPMPESLPEVSLPPEPTPEPPPELAAPTTPPKIGPPQLQFGPSRRRKTHPRSPKVEPAPPEPAVIGDAAYAQEPPPPTTPTPVQVPGASTDIPGAAVVDVTETTPEHSASPPAYTPSATRTPTRETYRPPRKSVPPSAPTASDAADMILKGFTKSRGWNTITAEQVKELEDLGVLGPGLIKKRGHNVITNAEYAAYKKLMEDQGKSPSFAKGGWVSSIFGGIRDVFKYGLFGRGGEYADEEDYRNLPVAPLPTAPLPTRGSIRDMSNKLGIPVAPLPKPVALPPGYAPGMPAPRPVALPPGYAPGQPADATTGQQASYHTLMHPEGEELSPLARAFRESRESSRRKHPGSPLGTDTVPAWLTPGEFVVNATAAARHRSELEAINSGATRKAHGGRVDYLAGGGWGGLRDLMGGWGGSPEDPPGTESASSSTGGGLLDFLKETLGWITGGRGDADVPGAETDTAEALDKLGKAATGAADALMEVLPAADAATKSASSGDKLAGKGGSLLDSLSKSLGVGDTKGGVSGASFIKSMQGASSIVQGAASGGMEGAIGALGSVATGPVGMVTLGVKAGMEINKAINESVKGAIKSGVETAGSVAMFAADASADPSVALAKFGDAVSKSADGLGGPFAYALTTVGESLKQLSVVMEALTKTAERYGEYSPQIAQAQAIAEVTHVLGDLRRAQESGGDLAKYIAAQGDLTQKFEDIKVKMLGKIVPVVTRMLEVVEAIMPSGQGIEQAITALQAALTVAIPGAASVLSATLQSELRPPVSDPTDMILKDVNFNEGGAWVPRL